MSNDILVGYARKSYSQSVLKLSINVKALTDCETYITSDGQQYISLVVYDVVLWIAKMNLLQQRSRRHSRLSTQIT